MKTLKHVSSRAQASALVLGLVVLAFVAGPPARAEGPNAALDYSIEVLEPPEGTVAVWWTYLNESGLVAMQYGLPGDPDFYGHAAILEDGTWKNIDVPGSISTGLCAPSASGRVPVTYVLEETERVFANHSAIYHRGSYLLIPEHEFYTIGLQSMNDHGILVALAYDPGNPWATHGALMNASLSLFETFDPPGSERTLPFGLNNAGLIVGRYYRQGEMPGFLYDGRTFTDITVPGATLTGATSINNRKTIVGWYESGDDGLWHGFILESGEIKDFTIPEELIVGEFYWMSVDCITDDGKLSGEYGDDAGDHPFVATPKKGHK